MISLHWGWAGQVHRARPGDSGLLEEEARIALFPVLDLAFGLFPADAMAFLDSAEELVALAGNDVEVVVRQLAPLLLDLPLDLLPVAFDGVLVHCMLLVVARPIASDEKTVGRPSWRDREDARGSNRRHGLTPGHT